MVRHTLSIPAAVLATGLVAVAVAVAGVAVGKVPGAPVVLAGRELPLTLRSADAEMRLLGAGTLTAAWFDVYSAALYLGTGVRAEDVLKDVPRRLEVYYLHDTPRTKMIETALKTLAANYSPARMSALRERLDRFHAEMRDGRKGDVAAITYIPGRGTEYSLNGKALVTIKGTDFGEAYFSVWIGEKPSSRRMKRYLLGVP